MIARNDIVALVLAVAATFGASCADRPASTELFTTVRFIEVVPGGSDVVDRAMSVIAAAEEYCWLAAETFDSTAVADALADGQARGLDIRVVGDIDHRDGQGFRRTAERLAPVDGVLPTRFGDGPLVYNPQLIDTVVRDGEHNRMTHNFLVCDDHDVVTATGGFSTLDTLQFAVEFASSDVGRDFADEFTQLYGGTFAATLSAYNGPLKSITDNRERYDSDAGRVEIYFGPQERPVKRLVDAVYSARAGIVVVAEELTSRPLAEALRYKAVVGFDVEVVVSTAGRDVPSSRYDLLDGAFAGLDNARIATVADAAVNAVLIDADPSPIDGRRHQARAMVFSAPILSATSIVEGQTTTARASDAFSDSNLVVLNQWPGGSSAAFSAVSEAIRTAARGGR